MKLSQSVQDKIKEATKNINKAAEEKIKRHEELYALLKQFENIKTAQGLPIKVGLRNQLVAINGVNVMSRIITLDKPEPCPGGLNSENVFVPAYIPFMYAYWNPSDTNFWVGGFATAILAAQAFGCLEEVVVGIVEKIAVN